MSELASEELCGYVLKKDSPSCGLERVKVYDAPAVPTADPDADCSRRGCVERFPDLPVEEEGRLSDPRLRENFVERVFAYWRLRDAVQRTLERRATLVRFHTAHKLILMAHSPEAYRQLGRLVARARTLPRRELEQTLHSGVHGRADGDRHADGGTRTCCSTWRDTSRTTLDRDSKAELLAAIEDYRRELVPLIVPMTLLRHYVRVHDVSYLAGQLYLEPHPKELMLRNHV